MPIIAEFSNGHVDAYKGTRLVRAAWMITAKATGKVLASGHSISLDAARKTAEGAVAEHHDAGPGHQPIWAPRGHTIAHIKCRARSARAAGWEGTGRPDRWIKARNAERKAARDASVIIEVIELGDAK